MSKVNISRVEYQSAPRLSYSEYGISRARYLELRNGCVEGKYSSETFSKACRGLEFIKPWIILSVTKSKSYDLIEFDSELGRVPVGRSNFYGFRREFYYNLDCLLKSGQDNLPMEERVMQKMNTDKRGPEGKGNYPIFFGSMDIIAAEVSSTAVLMVTMTWWGFQAYILNVKGWNA